MSFASACQSWQAQEGMKVFNATWGHLYPKLGTEHVGSFEFAVGTFSACDGQPVAIDFGQLPDSPVLYEDVCDFIFRQCFNNGSWEKRVSQPGIYRWTGTYRKCKNAIPQFIRGNLQLRYAFQS